MKKELIKSSIVISLFKVIVVGLSSKSFMVKQHSPSFSAAAYSTISKLSYNAAFCCSNVIVVGVGSKAYTFFLPAPPRQCIPCRYCQGVWPPRPRRCEARFLRAQIPRRKARWLVQFFPQKIFSTQTWYPLFNELTASRRELPFGHELNAECGMLNAELWLRFSLALSKL